LITNLQTSEDQSQRILDEDSRAEIKNSSQAATTSIIPSHLTQILAREETSQIQNNNVYFSLIANALRSGMGGGVLELQDGTNIRTEQRRLNHIAHRMGYTVQWIAASSNQCTFELVPNTADPEGLMQKLRKDLPRLPRMTRVDPEAPADQRRKRTRVYAYTQRVEIGKEAADKYIEKKGEEQWDELGEIGIYASPMRSSE